MSPVRINRTQKPLISRGMGTAATIRVAKIGPVGPPGIADDASMAAVIGSGGATDAALSATYESRVRSRRVWSIGDSLTAGNIAVDAVYSAGKGQGGLQYQPGSWQTWALLASDCRWTHAGVFATASSSAAQILATHVPEVIAAADPGDTVVVLAGTNGNVLADALSIHEALRDAGLRTVACTIPPSTASTLSSIAAFNEGLKEYAAANAVPTADIHEAVVDPTTGAYSAAAGSSDGIHPGTAGYRTFGETIAATLSALWETSLSLVNHNAAFTGQLKSNPLTSNALTVNTDYAPLTSVGTGSIARAANTNMRGGFATRFTRGDMDLNAHFGNKTLVAGHRMRVGMAIEATLPAGSFGFRLESSTTGTRYLFGLGYPTALPLAVGPSRFYVEFTVPTLPDYSYRSPRVAVTGAGSIVDFGEITVMDLTAMGLA